MAFGKHAVLFICWFYGLSQIIAASTRKASKKPQPTFSPFSIQNSLSPQMLSAARQLCFSLAKSLLRP
jgi:hypothetical protein